MTCEACQEVLSRFVRGEEPAPSAWAELRAHAKTCEGCRDAYNRTMMAERLSSGGPEKLAVPSPRALARIGAAVVEASAPAPAGFVAKARAWFASPLHWAPVAVAAMLAVAVGPSLLRAPHDSHDELQSRGTKQAAEAGAVRIFCIGEDGTVRTGSPLKCARNDQMSYTLSNRGYERLFLVGIDASYEPKWYLPRPPELESVAISDGVDMPIGNTIKLAVNHEPGPIRVFALYSKQAITRAEVEAAIGELKKNAVPLDGAHLAIARDGVTEQVLSFNVTP